MKKSMSITNRWNIYRNSVILHQIYTNIQVEKTLYIYVLFRLRWGFVRRVEGGLERIRGDVWGYLNWGMIEWICEDGLLKFVSDVIVRK